MASYDQAELSAAACTSVIDAAWASTYLESGVAAGSVYLGHESVLTGTAAATSTSIVDAYAKLLSSGASTSVLEASAVVTKTLASSANSWSSTIAAYTGTVLSVAAATSLADAYVDNLLSSVANAASVATPSNAPMLVLTSTASSSSSTVKGLLEVVLSSSAAVGTATPTRIANEISLSTAATTSSIQSAFSMISLLSVLESSGYATSTATMQVARTVYAQSIGYSNSSALFRDPNEMAWVMNTETEALSQYTNFAFDSIAYVDGKLYGACMDGIYVLEGADDEGTDIEAEAVSGFSDLGEQHTKHAGSMYFGYTSDGPVLVDVETYGSGHPKQSYELEDRPAESPRNNRVKLGKGLSSRHWRVTVKNKAGSHFELNDAAIDVAVSQRRI